MEYIMALDAGTTSCRCILFDRGGAVCALAQEEFNQYYPHPGWVEHDPLEIWHCQRKVARQAMEQLGVGPERILGVGIADQRETTVVWEKATGRPVYNAIVWQCHRTAPAVDELVAQGWGDRIREKTGLVPDAYFSATKLAWILDHVEGARERAARGELLFGTVDTWLIWNLTGGKAHVTDYTNASRTMLFNIHRLCWDEELLELFGVPRAMLPQVMPSSCLYGNTDPAVFGASVPVCGAAGDQQAAMFGQCCFAPGEAKNTYGTGCFLLMNTGGSAIASRHGLLTTIAASPDGSVQYALEGSIFIGGAVVQWLRDEMHLIDQSLDCEYYARKLPDSGGVYFVPAFTGLGAPYWNQYTRGCVLGLTRGTGKPHLIRAALEAIAYQTADVCRAMEQDSGISLSALKVDGGAARNDFLMQFQSDILNARVVRPTCVETTALGAAYLAGLAVGFWSSRDELSKNQGVQRVFSPAMDEKARLDKLAGWKRAIDCAIVWGDAARC